MSNKAEKESNKEKSRYNYQQVFQPSIFRKKKRKYFRLFNFQRVKWRNLVNKLKSRKVQALGLISLIFLAWGIGILLQLSFSNVNVIFKSSKHKADISEPLLFTWNVEGSFSQGIIIFGDGKSVELNHTSKNISHSYATQGKFTPIIRVWNQQGFSESKTLSIEIRNEAPQFEVLIVNTANEDDLVKIQVVNILESDIDLGEGILTYSYDFADNNQTTTKQNSIEHKWENAGTYPMTITLFDDQGALSQKTKYIEIINTPPKAYFDHNVTEDGVEFNAELSVDL